MKHLLLILLGGMSACNNPVPPTVPQPHAAYAASLWKGAARDTTLKLAFDESRHRASPELLNECRVQAQRAAAWLPSPINGPFTFVLHPSIEEKGLLLNNTSPVQLVPEKKEAHLVLNAYFGSAQLGLQNLLFIRSALGSPAQPFLEEGLAIQFNEQWQGKGADYWSAKLLACRLLPSPKALCNSQWLENAPPLIRQAAAASFARFLLTKWGKTEFLQKYVQWQPGPAALEQLQQEWAAYLKAVPMDASAEQREVPGYWKGFNFAHEGYSIYNGYGSRLSAKMLREIRGAGANAIALVPYSYMRDANAPSPIPVMQRAGTETDESTIRDAAFAKGIGLKTVLKPQIWLGRGQWPGDVRMASEQDWEQFFSYYSLWIGHYAILAAVQDIDLLCVGVEFAQATLARPHDWRKLFGQIKTLYPGPITYAANWGEEFEKVAFWDSVDAIGLNCYYPLSQDKEPDRATLESAFRQKMELARRISQRYQKPILLTEIGFTSTPTPWASPHVDGRGEDYSGHTQQLCYQVATEGIQGQEGWLKGILWWKYPSHPNHGGKGHTGFTPRGKPTADILPQLFGSLPD